MKEITRINPFSLAKNLTLVAITFGVLSALFGIISFQLTYGQEAYTSQLLRLALYTIGLYAIMGILASFFGAIFYNFFAKRIGGIKIDLK